MIQQRHDSRETHESERYQGGRVSHTGRRLGYRRDLSNNVNDAARPVRDRAEEPHERPVVAVYDTRTEFARGKRGADIIKASDNFGHGGTKGRFRVDHVLDEGLHEIEPELLLNSRSG
jgi:hypothetical protein